MSATFTTRIEGARDLEQMKAMATEQGRRFFRETPFEITSVDASVQAMSTHTHAGRVTMRASDPADDDGAGRQHGFVGYGNTPEEVEADISRQAREFFGPDVTLRVSRNYPICSAASSGDGRKLLRATTIVQVAEPGSVIIRPTGPRGPAVAH
jgi:hypothetical protein